MHRLHLPFAPCLGAALGLALALPAGPVEAQPAAQQTVIRAAAVATPPAPRADVARACPDMADTLVRELTPAVRMLGRAGRSEVQFRWGGEGVADVWSQAGPAEYRSAIRRALRAVECPHAAHGERFVLSIRFDPESTADDGARPWVAVLVRP